MAVTINRHFQGAKICMAPINDGRIWCLNIYGIDAESGLYEPSAFKSNLQADVLLLVLFFFAISGFISGYIAARLNKLFKGTSWFRAALATSVLLPGFLLVCYGSIEFIDWYERSTAYMPVSLGSAIVLIAVLSNFYLVSVGSYFGYRNSTIKMPVKTSRH